MSVDRGLQGRRVRLESTADMLADVSVGDEGTVRFYRWTPSGYGSLAVDWDNVSGLALIQGRDAWVLL